MANEASPENETHLRPGEALLALPATPDAEVYFIGTIHTPWTRRADCPHQGDMAEGPICRIDIAEPFRPALAGLEGRSHVQLLYWMDRARRDLATQSPRAHGTTRGTFSLRSPNRPNPIASSVVALVAVEPDHIMVRGLDCLDGTPLVDLKPQKCPAA
jgi:tRNA-Thr(GGU) m(6)t(6)A37 methyltransferase TsaA